MNSLNKSANYLEMFRPDPRVHSEKATSYPAVCLFASAGIGELGLERAGLDIIVANELIEYRADLYEENFPSTKMIKGDIWQQKDQIIRSTFDLLNGRELFLVYATPPCQGMSSNGAGKLRSEITSGRRNPEEERNRLIIPTMEIIKELQPRFVLLENVPQMLNTKIRNEADEEELILDFVERELGSSYVGCGQVLACEDFGIPQKRKRLISIFTRDPRGIQFFENNSNSFVTADLREETITLREAIYNLPSLDATPGNNTKTDFHPQHRVPIMDPRKYSWVAQTPEGATAFNNQCVNKGCKQSFTPGHKEELKDGKWTSVKETPIYCISCGGLLPRPTVIEKDGSLRAIKAFHSAYRRMSWDKPAHTITQNFIYEASDNKIHPSQNRVLSVYEAMVIQSISDYEYVFEINGRDIGIPKIAEVIGESVAPKLMEKLARKLIEISAEIS